MTVKLELKVIGEEKIHCSGCETRIGYALRRLPGIRDVRASAETQLISVTIDPAQVGLEQVHARLRELGYEVARGDASATGAE